jgi:serine/threonine protein kinase
LHHDEIVGILNEVDLMVRVDHPSIVKILAAYEDEKNFYLVMELVEGGEVSTFILITLLN